ncbi:unnamed protein product [Sphagnum troendelagicum]|uniref:Pentatricopeptide repeat-containing protein n=1 Tax=Sphagnum troendelagicum TaxID=128251 RepID=A0ABP0UDK8_9BRYO
MQLFEQMQQEGVRPNKFTFVQVIKACAGLGRLEDGRLVHEQLIQSGCESNVFLKNSMVDMYAKCGSIEDACRVFNKMPARDVVSWTVIILGHVKCGQGHKAFSTNATGGIHGNMEMAERVAKRIIEMEPENAAGYVLLSNIYTAAGSRHLCENVVQQRKGKGSKKQLGRTWIEVNNEVHAVVVEEQDHPQMIESHAEL